MFKFIYEIEFVYLEIISDVIILLYGVNLGVFCVVVVFGMGVVGVWLMV